MQEAIMTSDREAPSGDAAEEAWFVPRPSSILMDLPVAFQWAVTARHPHYQTYWRLAHRRHCQPSSDMPQRAQEEAAVLILLGIGVHGDPPPPGASAESLGAGSLSQGWESGAVAPLTYRGLVGMLLADLPPKLLAQVGRLFQERAAAVGQDADEKYRFLTELTSMKHPVLDAFPGRPVVGVNINAPQRVITAAVEQLVRRWKDQQGIAERRRRDDKLQDYLVAWDLREGWLADHYDASREKTLRHIAQELRIPLSTAANRYRSAFRLITGQDYSPGLWARLVWPIKVCGWLDCQGLPRRTLRRPWRDRQPRPVTEAALQGPGPGAAGVLNTMSISTPDIDSVDLVLDIQHLLAEGRSNEEIVAALELTSPAAAELIECLRQRHQDLL
jgi:hypothetical protein